MKKHLPPESAGTARAADRSSETRSRILQCARQQFNQRGVRSTAMFKIANELGMSPGNLTYHFKNKSELVKALAQELSDLVKRDILDMRHLLDPSMVMNHLEMILRHFWNFRFLFNSAVYLTHMDAAAGRVVQDIKKNIVAVLADYLQDTAQQGDMRAPRDPDGIRFMAENMLAIWLQWLLEESIANPTDDQLKKSGLLDCMRHHYSLIDPFVSSSFSEATKQELLNRYATGA